MSPTARTIQGGPLLDELIRLASGEEHGDHLVLADAAHLEVDGNVALGAARGQGARRVYVIHAREVLQPEKRPGELYVFSGVDGPGDFSHALVEPSGRRTSREASTLTGSRSLARASSSVSR